MMIRYIFEDGMLLIAILVIVGVLALGVYGMVQEVQYYDECVAAGYDDVLWKTPGEPVCIQYYRSVPLDGLSIGRQE